MSPYQIVPGNWPPSPCVVTSSGPPPPPAFETRVDLVAADGELRAIREMALSNPAVTRSPCMAPPKLEAAYSASPFVEAGKLVSAPEVLPEPSPAPGERKSHSTGLAAISIGDWPPNVFALLAR